MRLIEEVKRAVAQDPLLVPEFLQAVSDGMKQYKEAEETKRESLSDGAIRTLLGVSKIRKGTPVPWIIDVAFCQFPMGLSGHAPCEVEFWNRFIQEASKGVDMKWLRDIKGGAYVGWWHKYVEPAVLAYREAVAG